MNEAQPTRGCGSCRLCCTIMGVDMAPVSDFQKPVYTPCRHECKRGCAIYENRPTSCSSFECLWLFTQKLDRVVRMPKELRPDRTGVVIEVNTHGCFIAHCKTGPEWSREPMKHFLLQTCRNGTTVLVGHHETYFILNPDGTTEELIRVGVDKSGEVTYVRKAEMLGLEAARLAKEEKDKAA